MTGEEFSRPFRQVSKGAINYINLRINYLGLVLGKRMAEITTSIITVFILAGFAALIILMLTLAFVAWYGNKTGNYAQGFLIVSGFYFVLGFILFVARRTLITNPVIRMMNKKKSFDLNEKDEHSEIKNLEDLEKRIELLKLQIQYNELQMELNLRDAGELLKPANLLEMLIDSAFSSAFLSKILNFFTGKEKKKKDKDKKKGKDETNESED